MKSCELCGAENADGQETCIRCGFVFQREVRSDVRDPAILRKHGGKPVDTVNRDLRKARAKLEAYLDNYTAKNLSREELSTLLDDALSFLLIPLSMGVEDELRFDAEETAFIRQVAENLERADREFGSPVGTPGTYIRLSNALQAMGESDSALLLIESALLLNPRDRDAMLTRAKLLFYAKDYARARRCLEKILSAGDDGDARNLLELIGQMSPSQP